MRTMKRKLRRGGLVTVSIPSNRGILSDENGLWALRDATQRLNPLESGRPFGRIVGVVAKEGWELSQTPRNGATFWAQMG